MAVLNRFPNFSLPSQNLCPCHFSLELQQFVWENHRFPPRKLIMFASSSTQNSRTNAKTRTGKTVKSNVDLCTEIREFVYMVGLPEGHVPSFKELLKHGRKDLANIVRRRGYRLITELLTKPTEGDTNTETSLAEQRMDTDSCEKESAVESQDPEVSELAEGLLSSSDGSSTGDPFPSENGVLSGVSSTMPRSFVKLGTIPDSLKMTSNLTKPTEGDTITETSSAERQNDTGSCQNESAECEDQEVSELAEGLLSSSDGSSMGDSCPSESGVLPVVSSTMPQSSVELATMPSLLEKASEFVKSGELDKIEDAEDELHNEHNTSTANGTDKEIKAGSSSGQNPNNASALASKLVPPRETHSDDLLSAEGSSSNHATFEEDVETSARKNEDEIKRLNSMLHQRDLELNQLKEQMEKEKVALSTLQAKADNEIGKAEKIMSSKDEELKTVEESLCGLKEVEIEYWSHGESVEVAGSFNGWLHRIKMDPQPQPSSSSVKPAESRPYSTVLWLYPGIYEIKFVVDGEWVVDPKRESVTRGSIHNNILRVIRPTISNSKE